MNENSITPIIKEFERVFDELAKINKLKAKRPVITIQARGRTNALGWHWKDKWQNGKKLVTEINICAENLNKNPIETLIHEMVHYHNSQEKIEDCNRHLYHNKYFKSRAESYGLNVEKSGRLGWARTSISKKLEQLLKNKKIKNELFKLYRTNVTIPTSETKMKKYSCGCTNVRCATNFRATCKHCNQEFKEK